MDPQGRILLEQCSLALRDAEACIQHSVDQQTGVYVGVMHMEYIQYMTGAKPNFPLYWILVFSLCQIFEALFSRGRGRGAWPSAS